jgi:hypothetical protein
VTNVHVGPEHFHVATHRLDAIAAMVNNEFEIEPILLTTAIQVQLHTTPHPPRRAGGESLCSSSGRTSTLRSDAVRLHSDQATNALCTLCQPNQTPPIVPLWTGGRAVVVDVGR